MGSLLGICRALRRAKPGGIGMSQVPGKPKEQEEDEGEEEEDDEEDEEEDGEDELVGLADYGDGAESFSDGDPESGGDEACK